MKRALLPLTFVTTIFSMRTPQESKLTLKIEDPSITKIIARNPKGDLCAAVKPFKEVITISGTPIELFIWQRIRESHIIIDVIDHEKRVIRPNGIFIVREESDFAKLFKEGR